MIAGNAEVAVAMKASVEAALSLELEMAPRAVERHTGVMRLGTDPPHVYLVSQDEYPGIIARTMGGSNIVEFVVDWLALPEHRILHTLLHEAGHLIGPDYETSRSELRAELLACEIDGTEPEEELRTLLQVVERTGGRR